MMNMKPVLNWDDKQVLDDIRAICPPQLTKSEFTTFINTCRSMNLNPFTKEIYCLKNGTGAMQIIVARDGYRKVAQREAEYDYHQTDAVYSNDKFRVYHGEVEHEYDLIDRGKIIGAYCTVKRKSSSKSMYAYVEFKEYDLKRSLWTTKPATMIKKVAEAHALRMAFQDVFVGTYDKDELPEEMTEHTKESVSEPAHTELMIDAQQITVIDDLIIAHDISFERIEKGLNSYYRKQSIMDLTYAEADRFITQLRKIIQHEQTKTDIPNMEAQTIEQTTEEC
jgi:phage recombination protein Bet